MFAARSPGLSAWPCEIFPAATAVNSEGISQKFFLHVRGQIYISEKGFRLVFSFYNKYVLGTSYMFIES